MDRQIRFTLIAFVVLLALYALLIPHSPEYRITPPDFTENNATGGVLYTDTLTPPTAMSHAISAVALGNDLLAFWYGGKKEAKPEIALWSARYHSKTAAWDTPRRLWDPTTVAASIGRFVYTLGNPVAYRDPQNSRIWLFFVSVSIGGWSGSAINIAYSDDEGDSWSDPKQLVLSPLLNISTLVKTPPLPRDDGGVMLPVYHEAANKYAGLLLLDSQMSPEALLPMTTPRDGELIQPLLFYQGAKNAVALYRSMDPEAPFIFQNRTHDGGRHWSRPEPTLLPNPDAAIAGLVLAPDRWLLAYNHTPEGREQMDLGFSDDQGENWSHLVTIQNAPDGRLGYPWLVRTDDGQIHLLYTQDRKQFRHWRFDRRWLTERERQ